MPWTKRKFTQEQFADHFKHFLHNKVNNLIHQINGGNFYTVLYVQYKE